MDSTAFMNEIHIQQLTGPTVAEMEVEIVERKGMGHPDTICDAVMESVSQSLCKAYQERFGMIPHYNCDKALLVAGQVERRLGGGKVVEPMRLVIGDRATTTVGQEMLDVGEIAVRTAKEWFGKNLRQVDPERHLHCQVELKPGSEELSSLFLPPQRMVGSNDTSAAVGYAPLSGTEQLVLEAEHFLNSAPFKNNFPETGEDVKIMGVRSVTDLELTVAMPLLDRYVQSEEEYFRRKEVVSNVLLSHLHNHQQDFQELTLRLNALDRPGAGMAGMYLSVIGTSAEDADSGEVGRGNQVNGLISLNRPQGSEAAAGKNPVSHVGKIYNVLAHLLAEKLYTQVSGLRDVTVWLCSRIGEPIDRPWKISVQVQLDSGLPIGDVTGPIREVIAQDLDRLPVLCQELAEGQHPIC
jgi:S-adenosylmethionine synthetase